MSKLNEIEGGAMHFFSTFTLSGMFMLAPIFSLSASIEPEEEIKLRKYTFKQMGLDFNALGNIAKEKTPYNKDEVIRLVASLEVLTKKFPGFFSPISSKGDTKAKPEVWTESAKWSAATNSFQGEMGKFSSSVRNGGLAELKTSFQSTAQSCKSCHDNFRAR